MNAKNILELIILVVSAAFELSVFLPCNDGRTSTTIHYKKAILKLLRWIGNARHYNELPSTITRAPISQHANADGPETQISHTTATTTAART
jgi:hypothetical protein